MSVPCGWFRRAVDCRCPTLGWRTRELLWLHLGAGRFISPAGGRNIRITSRLPRPDERGDRRAVTRRPALKAAPSSESLQVAQSGAVAANFAASKRGLAVTVIAGCHGVVFPYDHDPRPVEAALGGKCVLSITPSLNVYGPPAVRVT
jgi:hypothetical protein